MWLAWHKITWWIKWHPTLSKCRYDNVTVFDFRLWGTPTNHWTAKRFHSAHYPGSGISAGSGDTDCCIFTNLHCQEKQERQEFLMWVHYSVALTLLVVINLVTIKYWLMICFNVNDLPWKTIVPTNWKATQSIYLSDHPDHPGVNLKKKKRCTGAFCHKRPVFLHAVKLWLLYAVSDHLNNNISAAFVQHLYFSS